MSSQQQYTWDVKAVSKSLVSGLEARDRNQESQEIHQTKEHGVKMAKRAVKSQEIHIAKGGPCQGTGRDRAKPGKLDNNEILQHTTSNEHSDEIPLSPIGLTSQLLISVLAK